MWVTMLAVTLVQEMAKSSSSDANLVVWSYTGPTVHAQAVRAPD